MRYSTIHHDVRQKHDLTVSEYIVCDSIYQLARKKPTSKTDTDIAAFVGLDRSHVGHCRKVLAGKGLIVESPEGWQTSDGWDADVLYAKGENPLERGKSPQNGENPHHSIYNNSNTSEAIASPSYVVVSETGNEPKERGSGSFTPSERTAYESMVVWADKHRGHRTIARTAQYAALKKAKKAKITSVQLKERWLEMEEKEYWRENGFDWVNVVKSFDKKPPTT